MSAALQARVRKRFPEGFALDVEVTVLPGITILFGRSGSGKSTLLDCIAGLLRPDQGRIAVGERVLFDSDAGVDTPAAARGTGFLFQDLALFPHLSVEENAAFGLSALPSAERRRRVAEMLETLRIPQLAARRPRELSGGERQRAALARTLVTQPRVLLLDEPLSALDLPTQSQLIADLRAWNRERQVPILYVTHSRREVFALGERVLVLEQGRVLAQGTPQEVLARPRHESVAQLAGFENIFDAEVAALHEDHGTMTCRVTGTAVELEVPLGTHRPGDPVRVGVRAGDILLAGELPRSLSARNVLPGRVSSLRQSGASVEADVDCGATFTVRLTPRARESLRLAPGREVWLVVKTYSCHLLEPSANS